MTTSVGFHDDEIEILTKKDCAIKVARYVVMNWNRMQKYTKIARVFVCVLYIYISSISP